MNRKVFSTFFFVASFLVLDLAIAQQSKTAEMDFASELAAVKTREETNQLLESKKHLVTPELLRALLDKGNQFRIWAEYSAGQHSFEQAKIVAEYLKDLSGVAEALNGIGFIQYMSNEFPAALENFSKSINISEAIGNQGGIAQSLNHIGRVHYLQHNFDVAEDYCQKSLFIRERLNDNMGIAESLSSIGAIHYMRGNNSKAMDYLKRSLALREELKDEEGIASSLNFIGLVELELRNSESAEAYFKKSLVLKERLGDKAGIVIIQSALGALQYHQSNYEEALGYYQKSLKAAEEVGNTIMQSWIFGSIGQAYHSLGQNSRALDSYQKSLELCKQTGAQSQMAYILDLMGSVHYSQGNYEVAFEFHKKALHITETLKDKKGSANSLWNLGSVYEMQEEYPKALEYYQKSLAIKDAVEDRYSISLLLNQIAVVQNKMGNLDLAMKSLERSLAISEAINNKHATIEALSSLSGIQFEKGNYPEALDFADRSVRLAKTVGARPLLWRSLTNLSKAYNAMNDPVKAIHSLEDAIHIIETLRIDVAGGEQEQQRFFENKVTPYHMIVDFLIQKNEKETEAFVYAERAKARALLDVLQSGRATITGAMTRAELQQEHELNRKLSSLNQQVHQARLSNQADEMRLKELTVSLEKARFNMEEFRSTIYASHPELKVQRGEVEVITTEKLNRLLPDSVGAFLEYVVTPEKTFLFVISKTENETQVFTKVYTINVKRTDLSSRIYNFQRQMASRAPQFRTEAAALHDLLIAPAEAILKTKRNLVIVPDDVLWELPFQALLSSEGRYLLEDYSLFYVPSLTVLNEMKNLKKKKTDSLSINLFAMGNPTLGTKTREQVTQVYRNANLDPLPEAEKEVRELEKLYGDEQSTIYLGADAREDRIKNEAALYNFIHLATHGLLNDSSPMYSQILLAQSSGQEEDGLLEAWEILNLKLNADLVVLSACDTALGKVGRGEGMIGLTWALFVAGVPTTVVSQWTVDSGSTTELMIQFHRELRSKLSDSSSTTPVPDALRVAALNLLRTDQYRHPFYWAPFVVIGLGF